MQINLGIRIKTLFPGVRGHVKHALLWHDDDDDNAHYNNSSKSTN